MITTPFRLIGLTDMQGNLLQAMKDSGTGPRLVRASAVLNAQAQMESVPQKTVLKAFRNQQITPMGICKFTTIFENRTITANA